MSDEKVIDAVEEDDTKPKSQDPVAPQWEEKKEFKIVREMRVIVQKTIEAAEAERDALRAKLEKLQYGG